MGSKPLSPTKSSQSYYDDGTTLKTRTGAYKINQKISAGGYGAVYNVTSNERKDLALKVELRNPNRNHFKLTMEIQVLEAAKKVEADNRKHFPMLYDQMRFKDRMFIVMTLLGESLADIKRKRPDRVFSLNTGLYCAIQCLTGIELLHKLGFVHRDIKPANFVVGRRYESNQNVVHMVDFGIARYCLDDKGKIKTPRGKLKFKGTVRFAPLATHKLQEVGWKDDCESWVYMVVDLIDTRRLPWQELEDREQVQALKEVAMTEPKKLFPEVERKDMAAIVKYLRLQHYVNQIDYNWMREAVKRVAEYERCTLEQPYDWMIPVKKK